MLASRIVRLAFPVALSLIAACENEPVGTTPPITCTGGRCTVDASSDTNFAGLQLGEPVTVTPRVDTLGTGWDVAFRTTTVRLNSGRGGPGTVRAMCLCRNQALDTAQLRTIDTAAMRARFDSVTAANIPADSLFRAETFSPAVFGWFTVTGTTTGAATRVFGFRRPAPAGASHPYVYAKLQVASITGGNIATGTGTVVLRYTQQATPLGPWGADILDTIQLGTAPQYVKLTTNAGASATDYDLMFTGYEVRLGPGLRGGTFNPVWASFAAAGASSTDPATGNLDMSNPNARWFVDATTNAFMTATSSPATSSVWYRYRAEIQQVYARHEIYLVKTPAGTFKVQPIGYYDAAGRERRVTVRYARIAN
jgi:hypothetical protein